MERTKWGLLGLLLGPLGAAMGGTHLGDAECGEHHLIPRLHRAGAQRLLQRAGVQPDELTDLLQLCA